MELYSHLLCVQDESLLERKGIMKNENFLGGGAL